MPRMGIEGLPFSLQEFTSLCSGPGRPRRRTPDKQPPVEPLNSQQSQPKGEDPEQVRKRILAKMVRSSIRASICQALLFSKHGLTFGVCAGEVQKPLEELRKAQVIEVIDARNCLTPTAEKVAREIFNSSAISPRKNPTSDF